MSTEKDEILRRHPEFAAYVASTKILIEITYNIGPVKMRVVPNIDFSQEEFKPLILNLGDKFEMAAFSEQEIMPVIGDSVQLFYDKERDEVQSLVIANSMFTEMFIIDEVTEGVKRALRLVTAKDERSLIPFAFEKAGFYGLRE